MRFFLTLSLVAFGQTAVAHPGHLADVAGHDHWVAGAAIGAAILIGLIGALKGKKDAEKAEAEPELEEEAA